MLDQVWTELVVVAAGTGPGVDGLTVEILQNRQQHHAGNPAAAWRAEAGEGLAAFDKARAHARQRSFAGGDAVGLAAAQAVGIAALYIGGKVIHLIVQQHPGTGCGKGGAERQVDRQRRRHRIALGVEHREVGGVVAFLPGFAGRQAVAWGGALRVDAAGQLFQISRGQQLLCGIADKVRVTQQAAVAVGAAQGFHHQVSALHAVSRLPGQLLQHQQALPQSDTAGRRWWCADQLAALIQRNA